MFGPFLHKRTLCLSLERRGYAVEAFGGSENYFTTAVLPFSQFLPFQEIAGTRACS